jgi:hypothetical protein
MQIDRKVVEQALDYIDNVDYEPYDGRPIITALRDALAQPESEYELAGYSTLEHLVYLSRVVPSPDRIPIYVKPVIKNHQENV